MLAADVVAHLPAGTLAGVVTLSGPPDVPSGYQCLQPEYAAIFPRLVAPTDVDGYRSTLLAFAVREPAVPLPSTAEYSAPTYRT